MLRRSRAFCSVRCFVLFLGFCLFWSFETLSSKIKQLDIRLKLNFYLFGFSKEHFQVLSFFLFSESNSMFRLVVVNPKASLLQLLFIPGSQGEPFVRSGETKMGLRLLGSFAVTSCSVANLGSLKGFV